MRSRRYFRDSSRVEKYLVSIELAERLEGEEEIVGIQVATGAVIVPVLVLIIPVLVMLVTVTGELHLPS